MDKDTIKFSEKELMELLKQDNGIMLDVIREYIDFWMDEDVIDLHEDGGNYVVKYDNFFKSYLVPNREDV